MPSGFVTETRVRAFPTVRHERAEQAFRSFMAELTGLEGDELEEWIEHQLGHVDDELEAISRRIESRHVRLTPAERRVVLLLAAGYSNREIAAELALAYDTVKRQLLTAKRRAGARTAESLVTWFLLTGQWRIPD